MLAIIDGDVLAYQACPSRKMRPRNNEQFQVIDLDEGEVIQEDQSAEPVAWTPEEDAEYLKECWDTFKRELNVMVEKLFCDDFVMAVRGDACFRYDLFDDYKKQRSKHYGEGREQLVNDFVPALRSLAVHEEIAIPSHGREADDWIRIWANEAKRAGQEYIICSIDKDLRCIPGKHYIMHYLKEKQVILDISEDDAMRFYYEQLLKGDPTDNIPGVPRVGEVKAKALISDCLTEEDMQERVVSKYVEAYGDDWYNHFLINAKLIHIQSHIDDYFDPRQWPIIQELTA
jgi:hypothetical protein